MSLIRQGHPPDPIATVSLVLVSAPTDVRTKIEHQVRTFHAGTPQQVSEHAYLRSVTRTGSVTWAGPFGNDLARPRGLSQLETSLRPVAPTAMPATPAIESDFLKWAVGLDARSPTHNCEALNGGEPGNDQPVPVYASALGVRDAACLEAVGGLYFDDVDTIKVDLCADTPRDLSQTMIWLSAQGKVALDAQRRFPSLAAARECIPPGLSPHWLEDPCHWQALAPTADLCDDIELMVGEHEVEIAPLSRAAKMPNVTVNLEVRRLGPTATLDLLRWLGKQSLTCRLHGVMPQVAAFLASMFPGVVRATELHLAWASERLSTLKAFQDFPGTALEFVRTPAARLDMTPIADSPHRVVRNWTFPTVDPSPAAPPRPAEELS